MVGLGENRFRRRDEAKGLLVQLEPGLGGVKFSAGAGAIGPHATGRALRLSVLRTWGDPWGAATDETYVGPELSLAVFGVETMLGALYRVSGTQRDDWELSAGLGIGF